MSARRSKLEIVLSVLTAIRDGEDKPTRIMYAANMSWNPTQEVLSRLADEGFIQTREESAGSKTKRRYEITEKGLKVVDYFEVAKALINI